MSKLKEKLNEAASDRLENQLERAKEALVEICADSNVSVAELAKLICGSRTDTLKKTLVRRISSRLENDLLARYQDTEMEGL